MQYSYAAISTSICSRFEVATMTFAVVEGVHPLKPVADNSVVSFG
jgi:hypothetical protein